jgi:glycosyltransferase involved in cell wall biosynthesis
MTNLQTTVIVCTRNRGALIQATLESILSGSRIPDELLVVDQSDNSTTRDAVTAFAGGYPNLRYIGTETRGLSVARNLGLQQSQGDIIAFTDDDVIVCREWLELLCAEFHAYPDLALLFGTVLPPDTYDWRTQFVPYTILPTTRPVRWRQSNAPAGIGANMALSRAAFQALGGYDEALGAGTLPLCGEDYEYALRALCCHAPLRVHYLNEAQVIHHAGARSGAEYHRFVRNVNGTGMGLFWAHLLLRRRSPKYWLKFAQWQILPWKAFLGQVLRGKKPTGVATYCCSWAGFIKGARQVLFAVRRR